VSLRDRFPKHCMDDVKKLVALGAELKKTGKIAAYKVRSRGLVTVLVLEVKKRVGNQQQGNWEAYSYLDQEAKQKEGGDGQDDEASTSEEAVDAEIGSEMQSTIMKRGAPASSDSDSEPIYGSVQHPRKRCRERETSIEKARRIVMTRPRYWDREKITEEMYLEALSKVNSS
jgi:hypothetical protein